jgi:hypothetical protein
MTSQTTSPDASVELIRATFDAFNANDIDTCIARLELLTLSVGGMDDYLRKLTDELQWNYKRISDE